MKKYMTILLVIAGTVLLSFILSYPIMFLWNACLVDAITIAKPITWLQAWGLVLLLKMFSGVSVEFNK